MAADLSARKRASLVLALPVVQLTGAFLRVTYGYGRVCWLHMPDLVVSGRGVTLAKEVPPALLPPTGSAYSPTPSLSALLGGW